jgi:hypothetical protein
VSSAYKHPRIRLLQLCAVTSPSSSANRDHLLHPTNTRRLHTDSPILDTAAAMAEEISLNALLANVVEWKDRLVNNSIKSWEEMSAQRWLRIVIIVGAYLLVRPYLLAHAERSRKKRAEKEAADLGLDAGTTANDFRGGKKSKGDEGLVQRSSLR